MFPPSYRRPLEPDFSNRYDGPSIVRVELTAALLPGQSALAKRVFFNGASGGSWTTDSSGLTVNVYDSLYMVCAFPLTSPVEADRIWVMHTPDMVTYTPSTGGGSTSSTSSPQADANRYETIHEFGLLRRIQLTASLAQGGSASALLGVSNSGAFVSSGQTITVFDTIMSSGDTASSGKQGWARYEPAARVWLNVSLQCG